jgi:hypothetical protein
MRASLIVLIVLLLSGSLLASNAKSFSYGVAIGGAIAVTKNKVAIPAVRSLGHKTKKVGKKLARLTR